LTHEISAPALIKHGRRSQARAIKTAGKTQEWMFRAKTPGVWVFMMRINAVTPSRGMLEHDVEKAQFKHLN
jgi:hypothetical protein